MRSEKQKLIISTQKPKETTWTFSIAEKAIIISCSADNAVVQGIAPASEDRIPARIKSQDNEILYTSLGFVSSNNIYCLFDRETDTMIQFPEQSDFNWGEEVGTKTVSFGEDLGLETGREYLAFDFWNQELKEVTGDRITCSIPSHGTRVYVIRPILDRPQLVATSRHITGTISPKQVLWEPAQSALSGSSEIVEGAPYSLFIYVPEGWRYSRSKRIQRFSSTKCQTVSWR